MRYLFKKFFILAVCISPSIVVANGYSGADLYFVMSALESSSPKNAVAYTFLLSCQEKNCSLKFQEIERCKYHPKYKHDVMTFDDDSFHTNENSLKVTQVAASSLLLQFEKKSLLTKYFNLLVNLEQPYPDDNKRDVKHLEGSVSYKTFQSIDKKVEKLKLVKEYALKRACPIYLY